MPYRIRKKPCVNSDDENGTHVLQKKENGKWVKASCHKSRKLAKGAMGARGAAKNESQTFKISKARVEEIISEELAKTFGGTHPDEAYVLGTKKNLMLDRESQHGGWPEGEYDPPVNKRIYDYLKSLGMIQ